MTLEEIGRRARRAADLLHGSFTPADEVRGPREDLHDDDVEPLLRRVICSAGSRTCSRRGSASPPDGCGCSRRRRRCWTVPEVAVPG